MSVIKESLEIDNLELSYVYEFIIYILQKL